MVRSLLFASALGFFSSLVLKEANASDAALFESDIAPLLVSHCLECHQGLSPAGGLDLTTADGFRRGGDSGKVFDQSSPLDSLILLHVTEGTMPPPLKGKPQKLSDTEIASLQAWVNSEAHWPPQRTLDWFERTNTKRAGRDWWSLQPLQKTDVPPCEHDDNHGHPIDAFIRYQLANEGLSPSPIADPATRIRRLYFDVLGLPPDDSMVVRFMSDPSPQAWNRVVDHVLASPFYGQRWGRHWLDLVRFAETSGYERDQEKPYAWKYRDWVIASLNDDLPYDKFVTAQLAGDQLPDRTEDDVIATGFLRLGTWNDEPNDPQDYLYERLEDLVHTTSTAFLGMTMKCARCHSHKFDPISQMDYYRMAAAFWPGPIRPRSSSELGGPTTDELGFDSVLGWTDLAEKPSPLMMLKNGERNQPLSPAVAGTFSFLPSTYKDFVSYRDILESDSRDSARFQPKPHQGTGYRLQLANWITDPDNPLTYRVIVNRIWQHHFGHGLVRTPNNFGFLAAPPTHPELLDWLARQLIENGGSLKALHRLILTSETYQQSSDHPLHDAYTQIDAGNRNLWHAERQRLDSETLRDNILAATGEINLAFGGLGFVPFVQPEALEGLSQKSTVWKASTEESQSRRAVYRYSKRGLIDPMATVFDFCDTTQPCGQREESTVPTQALTLLNNPWAHERSRHLARRGLTHVADPKKRIQHVWNQILRRDPTDVEMDSAYSFIQAQSAAFKTQQHAMEQNPVKAARAELPSTLDSLRFWISADSHVELSTTNSINAITDRTTQKNTLHQDNPNARPTLRPNAIGTRGAFHFSGEGQFLYFKHVPVTTTEFTIVTVATDESDSGHREIVSNWNSDGNIGTSLFLGLTQENQVRFTDAFSDAGRIADRRKPFILTATHGINETSVYCNGQLLSELPHGLADRRIDTPWVMGQQGNIQGEYWKGLIAELRIYGQPLTQADRKSVEKELSRYYDIPIAQEPQGNTETLTPELYGLASLCHVLFNSNEFLYVD